MMQLLHNKMSPEESSTFFKQRAEARAENLRTAIETKEWHSYLFWACGNGDRPEGLQAIESYLSHEEYWKLLAEVWTEYDATIVFDPIPWHVWNELFTADRPKRSQLMSRSERRRLRELPTRLKVYRGCRAGMELEMSWTLSLDIAQEFAQRQTDILRIESHVISAEVHKRDVYAYFNTKREQEIVWQPPLDTDYEIADRICPARTQAVQTTNSVEAA